MWLGEVLHRWMACLGVSSTGICQLEWADGWVLVGLLLGAVLAVRGTGRGGRNVEFALSLAIALAGERNIHALAADTDGVDGMEQVAGAIIDPESLVRARAQGLDPIAMLEDNDAHSLFERLGDQVITGPTQTNVNDFRAILVDNVDTP